MRQLFRDAEDAYHQHLEGHLDPRVWRGLEAVMREINTAPGVQAWWRSHSHWFGGEEFVKFINHQQQIESCLRHRRLYKRKPKELQNCRRFSFDAARPMAGRRIDPSPRTVESPTTPDGATLRYGRSPARGKNRKRWLARFALTK
jgi:hypothetical protein